MTPSDRPRPISPGQLTEGLNDLATTQRPTYRDDLVLRIARTRQRPAWTFIERWLPMSVIIARPASAAPMRAAWMLLLIGLLTAALVASVAIVGSRLLPSTGPDEGLVATAIIPQGDEAVFALATWVGGPGGRTGGDIYSVKPCASANVAAA